MMKHLFSAAACAALFLLSTSAVGTGLVREFSGSASTTTAEFIVDAPWLLDWRVNSEYTQALGFEVSLVDGRTGRHAGRVLKTKLRGNGVKLFDQSGRYRLRIDAAHANWQIKIIEISEADAKLYTPRGQR